MGLNRNAQNSGSNYLSISIISNLFMNKAGIVEKVHESLGTTKAEAERTVETMVDSILEELENGNEVSIANLGIFSTKMRAARTARNPKTGEAIEVPAQRVVKFKVAKSLKERVK